MGLFDKLRRTDPSSPEAVETREKLQTNIYKSEIDPETHPLQTTRQRLLANFALSRVVITPDEARSVGEDARLRQETGDIPALQMPEMPVADEDHTPAQTAA